uniref:Uncharacterized protein n=1 Tax=Chromera velia CCMP2878 TaxID=1169474 RepID=A0A0G4HA17_9ALVE|mmetsp:Transcript_17412/g.35377  ORF Transcript_17412/g.35377 Transcript_17412/m.35377 type:complete len:361 (-) Transcript_17412:295-1377(-)|eukprot:Cvel_6044.t1-p1 / transcript=Cvel_6044.t1 / gene=Cvel_6044 / organism=Chromera_velia_CCMP2878 / gene_product=Ankyrin-1, putative / transcript_product=Ankyrin-1, putative / location=Cvel_scaffold290:68953-73567(-) / protein_length=360 / sequence_SO=supercontig / SO=protein_coding / is_pseudo=false
MSSLDGAVRLRDSVLGLDFVRHRLRQFRPVHLEELWKAIKDGRLLDALLLLYLGADVDGQKEGRRPLHLAASLRRSVHVEVLLAFRADCNLRDGEGNSPLVLAVKAGDERSALALIREGDEIAKGTPERQQQEEEEEKETDVTAENNNSSPSSSASSSSVPMPLPNLEAPSLQVLREGAPCIACMGKGRGLRLRQQRERDRAKASSSAELELQKGGGGNPFVHATMGDLSVLHGAASRGLESVVTELVARGADVDAVTKYGETPLHIACDNGHGGTAISLLRSGASLSATTKWGRTGLHWASLRGLTNVVEEMVERGALLSPRDADGATAGDLAARGRHPDVVDLLRKAHTKVHQSTSST